MKQLSFFALIVGIAFFLTPLAVAAETIINESGKEFIKLENPQVQTDDAGNFLMIQTPSQSSSSVEVEKSSNTEDKIQLRDKIHCTKGSNATTACF